METGAASWTWSDQNWGQFGGEYERCNLGRQSPIELFSTEGKGLVGHGSVSGPIYFHNFADDTPGTFTNDGHNLIFEPDETDMYIEKGTLPDLATNFKYETIRATLHWGANDTVGSNHVIDGKRYAAEMVLHQRNRFFESYIASQSPGTPPEEFALRYYHGYMGISLLFETKPHAYNYAFEPILEAAEALAAEGSTGTVRGSINVRDLMKDIGTTSPELFDYYAYRGSRMTPSPKEWPCSQAYGYIVPSATITIGKCQVITYVVEKSHWGKNPQKFTFSKSHFPQNSPFHSLMSHYSQKFTIPKSHFPQNFIFNKIHNCEVSFFTKFTFFKNQFLGISG